MKKILSLILSFIILIIPFSVSTTAEVEPIFGIDVSRWQGAIDWNAVKNDGVNFVILRAYSYGEDYNFQENYAGAIAAGLDVGAYSYTYAETIDEAIQEANDLVAVLGKREFQYPIFIDIEDPYYYGKDKSLTTQIVKTELEILTQAGYYAAIYSGKNFVQNYINISELSDYDLWVAQYYSSCTYEGDYTMWQFSDSGSIDGISGNVDTNYCYVDYPQIIAQSGLNYISDNSTYPRSGVVTADLLNLREGPSTNFDVVTKIPQNSTVTINGVEGVSGWAYVSFFDAEGNYFTGYCSREYITIQSIYELLGDVNLSQTVDADDALAVLLHVTGKALLPDGAHDCADVNRDGEISPNDALLILQFFVGKINSFI